MGDYVVIGKKGNGKTLLSVSIMREYLASGRRVATNIDLHLDKLGLPGPLQYTRLPDLPTGADLEALGRAYEGGAYDEKKFGAIVLDEAGVWLNNRNWQDKNRQALGSMLRHLRKMRWDLYCLIQHYDALDKQVADIVQEHTIVCRRLDRLKLFGIGLPKIHVGQIWYGRPLANDGFKVGRHVYRGTALYQAYDTEQRINGAVTVSEVRRWAPEVLDAGPFRRAVVPVKAATVDVRRVISLPARRPAPFAFAFVSGGINAWRAVVERCCAPRRLLLAW